ncbi:lysophospholipid acyltransferase family protein [Solimonas terrae]|uniref:Lysophospholipid acyltransferase family protein n=1 Tax=Solimonas terrae TaxID=1396819 RepID=A0A6M2BS56_9GAMM|nr:lysophospholipid acyltransferase family protein [Solimonas terrae]
MRLLFALGRHLPLRVLHFLGDLIGGLAWCFDARRRRLALRNIELCFPERTPREQRRMAYRASQHYYKSLLEYPLIWTGDAGRVHALAVETHGRELIDHALAQGKGLIIAALHLGSFEAAIIPLSAHYPITGMYKPVTNPELDRLSREGRMRFGAKLVAIVKRHGKRAVGSELLRALKRGEIVYALPDRDPPRGQGVFAPYFGINAHSPILSARLIQATGARMLICTGERLPKGRGFIIRLSEPPAGYDSDDLGIAAEALNRGIEACVRACPEQNWWAYERFKRRPFGEYCFYKGTQQLPKPDPRPDTSVPSAS